MSPEPANNMRLLPTRSAIMVKKMPRKTSPSSVRVMKRPIWKSVNFSSAKNNAGIDGVSPVFEVYVSHGLLPNMTWVMPNDIILMVLAVMIR